jgi:hypothetical protein
MAHPVEPVHHLLQRREKRPAILVIVKNGLAPVTARGNVIKRIGKRYADWARHNENNGKEKATYLDPFLPFNLARPFFLFAFIFELCRPDFVEQIGVTVKHLEQFHQR